MHKKQNKILFTGLLLETEVSLNKRAESIVLFCTKRLITIVLEVLDNLTLFLGILDIYLEGVGWFLKILKLANLHSCSLSCS